MYLSCLEIACCTLCPPFPPRIMPFFPVFIDSIFIPSPILSPCGTGTSWHGADFGDRLAPMPLLCGPAFCASRPDPLGGRDVTPSGGGVLSGAESSDHRPPEARQNPPRVCAASRACGVGEGWGRRSCLETLSNKESQGVSRLFHRVLANAAVIFVRNTS